MPNRKIACKDQRDKSLPSERSSSVPELLFAQASYHKKQQTAKEHAVESGSDGIDPRQLGEDGSPADEEGAKKRDPQRALRNLRFWIWCQMCPSSCLFCRGIYRPFHMQAQALGMRPRMQLTTSSSKHAYMQERRFIDS